MADSFPSPQDLWTSSAGRWNKGRDWDGMGPWCDAQTSEDLCHMLDHTAKLPNMTVSKLLQYLAAYYPDKRAITYLDNKGRETENQSFGEVTKYVRRIGAYLQCELGMQPGDRAILLYPPGSEFILGYLGCLHAGVIAVPVYPPHPYRLDKELPKLNLIVKNSGAKVALCDSKYMLVIRGIGIKNKIAKVGLTKSVAWPSLRNVQTDKVRKWYAKETLIEEPQPSASDMCFLQYTSGSTSAPKGVIITHGSLMAQLLIIWDQSCAEECGYSNNRTLVSWLPQYHDMGLLGNFLAILLSGCHLIYMSPVSFLQDPTLWMSMISKYQADSTSAPNFAFALATAKTPPKMRDKLDLKCLMSVGVGAEPIRPEVMEAFYEYFKPAGFNPLAIRPGYGLAEFTLCATVQAAGLPLNVLYLDQHMLTKEKRVRVMEKGDANTVCYVGVGEPMKFDNSLCRIVDAETREDLGEGRVGEIWLWGPSIAGGYYCDEERTAEAFRGVVKGEEDSDKLYLRTGDQGFIHQKQLFITGRIKDLIIIRGRNLYPQDIEYTVEQAMLSYIEPSCSAAFAVDVAGMETVVYCAALRKDAAKKANKKSMDAMVNDIRTCIAENFEVSVYAILLLEPETIPKTVSNKIQRHKCREGFLNEHLKTLHVWRDESGDSLVTTTAAEQPDPLSSSAAHDEAASASSPTPYPTESTSPTDNRHDLTAPTSAAPSPTSSSHPSPPRPSTPATHPRTTTTVNKSAAGSPAPSVTTTCSGTTSEGEAQGGLSVRAGTESVHARSEQEDDEASVVASTTFTMSGEEREQEGGEAQRRDGAQEQENLAERERDFIEKLVLYVVKHRNISYEMVNLDEPMSLFGFDSAGFVALGKVMGDWVGKEISPAIVYKYTTIRDIAGFLARGANEDELSAGPSEEDVEPDLNAPIAIVGIGVKAPGGAAGNLEDKEAFWRFMLSGGDAVVEDMPVERKADPNMTLPGAYVANIDRFDAPFFGMSPAEASHLDYQQAVVLETTWHALEDAGIDPKTIGGRVVGVYVGAMSHEFAVFEALRGEQSTFAATGVSSAMVANRVSYVLNLRGPSVTIDTACSASLVTVHDAVRDLRLGATSIGLAGGVNLVLNSEASAALKRAGFLSTACRTFDATGDGYARGEGCGMVVLKRLDRALADGDRVYAVIRGSAVNHDGRTTSLTAPNPLAQEAVQRAAYKDANVSPAMVRYIEAHGTGTKLGDSIEMAALGATMSRPADMPKCYICSAKSNIGHLECAAGIIGLIRATLVLYHGTVPKAVHFDNPNPHIPWERLPFVVPTTNTPLTDHTWEAGQTVIAGVNSFGFGGTNSHVILESMTNSFDFTDDYDHALTATAEDMASQLPLLLPISAHVEPAMRVLAGAYKALLTDPSHPSSVAHANYDRLMEFCLDAATRRVHQTGYRIAATGRTAGELAESLTRQLDQSSMEPVTTGAHPPEVVFLFTGQGSQYAGMGGQLYRQNAVFRAHVDECDRLMSPHLDGASIVQLVINAADDTAPALTRTLYTQPAIFAVEYALCRIWALLGVEADVVMGHSVGEVVAAVEAGVMSVEDGCALVCARARCMDALPQGVGGMTVVFDSLANVETLLSESESTQRLEVAAVNGETVVNVAGPLEGLEALEGVLRERAVKFRRLDVSHAFHSSAMDPALPALLEAIEGITFHAPKRAKLVSLVTGTHVTDALTAQHWADNVRKPVLFLPGLHTCVKSQRPRVIIEVGPDPSLISMARRELPADPTRAFIASLTKSHRDDENLYLTEAIGRAYVAGLNLKFKAVKAGSGGAPYSHHLPLYPFQGEAYANLTELTSIVLSKINGNASSASTLSRGGAMMSLARKDYGTTYLMEEAWLPREPYRHGQRPIPPVHTTYVINDEDEVAWLASVKALSRRHRSYTIVVPKEQEIRVRQSLKKARVNLSSIPLVGLNLASDYEGIKEAVRGPPGASQVAIVFITGSSYLSTSASASAHVEKDIEGLTTRTYKEAARLLGLLRALAEMAMGDRLRLWVVTTRAKKAVKSDRVQSVNGALFAMVKSAMQESWPALFATLIDLDAPMLNDQKSASRFLEIMDNETATYGTGKEPPQQFVLRGDQWLVMRLRQAPLQLHIPPAALKAMDDPAAVELPSGVVSKPVLAAENGEREGWYIITGGLGGLGLHVARALLRHGAKKLILTSRRGVVPEQYTDDLTDVESAAGVTVRCVACDTADAAAVDRLFAEYAKDGAIRGVVHAAGVMVDGHLRTQTIEKLDAVWSPKADGIVNLYRNIVRLPRPLKLFLLYGSSSALVGSPAEANYSAANAVLDSVSHIFRQNGLSSTSIQWGCWLHIGFANPLFVQTLHESGFPGISKGLGHLVLNEILNRTTSAPPVISCNPTVWNQAAMLAPLYMLKGDLSAFEAVKNRVVGLGGATAPPTTEDMKQYSSIESFDERRAHMEGVLVSGVKHATGKTVTATDSLAELSIPSLEAVELVENLTRRYPLRIQIAQLLEFSTLRELASYFCDQLDKVMDANRYLPMSQGQQLIVASGIGRDCLFTELKLTGALATPALLNAWRLLVSRHTPLRTLIDLHGCKQRSIAGADLASVMPQMFAALPDAAGFTDHASVDVIVADAVRGMSEVPPARLLVSTTPGGGDACVVLAVSRVLVDRWSIHMLASELLTLYGGYESSVGSNNAPLLGPPSASFHDELMRLSRLSLAQNAPTYNPEAPYTHVQLPGLRLTTAQSEASTQESEVSWRLSEAAVADVHAFVAKARVPASVVLLSAYVLTLWEVCRSKAISVVVDVGEVSSRQGGGGEVVGPLSVPFRLDVEQELRETHRQLAARMSSMCTSATQALHAPPAHTEGMSCLPEDVPAYTFDEAATTIGGTPGQHGLSSSCSTSTRSHDLLLRVSVSRSSNSVQGARYDVTLSTGAGRAMDHLSGFKARLDDNIRKVTQQSTAKVAEYVSLKEVDSGSRGVQQSSVRGRALPWVIVAVLQLLGIMVMGSVMCAPVLLVWPAIQYIADTQGQYAALASVPVAYNIIGLTICVSVLILRTLIARRGLPAGDYTVNSPEYLRWWFLSRLTSYTSSVYINHMRGTIFYTWWLRELGAEIGRGARIDGVVMTDPDLVTIADGATLTRATLTCSIVRDGVLKRGRVEVGKGACVGANAVMLPGSRLGDHATLEPLSVAVEGQLLAAGGVYEAAPARFRRPRGDVAAHTDDATPACDWLLNVTTLIVQALLGPILATVSSALAYPVTAQLAILTKILPFLGWSQWVEGPVLFAVSACCGLIPMLGYPTLLASMKHYAKALLLPDSALVNTARAAGFKNITAEVIRQLLNTQQGVKLIAQTLPKGVTIVGEPGTTSLTFVASGEYTMRYMAWAGTGLASAKQYYVVGLFWPLAVGYVVQGFLMAAMTTVVYWVLMIPTAYATSFRAHGIKASIRQIKVTLLRWTYDRFMRLFIGTDILVWWYWTLGASVGRRVLLGNTDIIEDPHLLHLNDDSAITDFSCVLTSHAPGNGYVHTTRVHIGKRCIVGVRAVVQAGSTLADGTVVMPASSVDASACVEQDAVLLGVPAKRVMDRFSLPGEWKKEWAPDSTVYQWVVTLFTQGLAVPLTMTALTLLIILVAGYPGMLFLLWTMAVDGGNWSFAQAKLATAISYAIFFTTILVLVALEKWLLGNYRQGWLIRLRGPLFFLRSFTLLLQNFCATLAFDTLRGSVFAPLYLRMLGATVHPQSFVNTLNVTEPDLVEVGKNAVLDQDSTILSSALEDRSIHLGKVKIEGQCRMGVSSIAMRDAVVYRGAECSENAVVHPARFVRPKAVRFGNALLDDDGDRDEDAVLEEGSVSIIVPFRV